MALRDRFTRRKRGRYDGPVVFGLDGFHYPVDANGQPAGKQPLVWHNDTPDDPESNIGHYEWAIATDATHFHRHGLNPKDVSPA